VSVCGTGTVTSTFRSFSWHHEYGSYGSEEPPDTPQPMPGRFSDPDGLDAPTGFSVARLCFSECVPPSLHDCGAGILTCCPSAAPFGLTLGPDFPWADDPSPGTLVLTADGILTRLIVTHTGIRTSTHSNSPSGLPSPQVERSPTRNKLHATCQSAASVQRLSPDHFRRIVTRPVSYYALFEGWLLLSQPPGCHCDDTSLSTER
jgi:hypothetical protein